MDSIIDWIISLMEVLGAPGVGIAILLENLFPPIPSEVVLPLAGFTVSQGNLHFWTTYIWATAGSVVGAWLLYWLGAAIGAERLRKIADRMWLVNPQDVDKSLAWFERYGPASVFFGRLIPGVRSLISIPAGVDRMNLLVFSLWTLAGSALWNALLLGAGVLLGDQWELVEHYYSYFSDVIKIIAVLAAIAVLAWLIRRKKKATSSGNGDTTK